MLKLLLACLLVVAIYSLYKYMTGAGESAADAQASNEQKAYDARRAVEAEYRIIEEGEREENG